MELINPLLGNSFVEMLLLGTQVAEVGVDFSKCGRLLVDFLVRGLALAEDAEGAVHTIADSLGD